MLNYEDGQPTIKFAIERRLDKEPGVRVLEVKIQPHPTAVPAFIAVGVLAIIDEDLIATGTFHLPWEFEHIHLLNEIDEIAEGYKLARINVALEGKPGEGMKRTLLGTGLRGRWEQHA
jgi:hypothetical protein